MVDSPPIFRFFFTFHFVDATTFDRFFNKLKEMNPKEFRKY